MTKTLFLLRHAKAMTGGIAVFDQDRALAEKGIKQVNKLANKLAKKELNLDLMISSPAVRAISTAQVIMKSLNHPGLQLVLNDELYGTEMMTLLKIISKISKKIDTLMIVGHNPGLMNLATFMAGEPISVSTCALIKFTFDFKDWHEIFTTRATKFSFIN
ncbi:MAG: SixA phosphatase family protein [Polynucleobacter sp.]